MQFRVPQFIEIEDKIFGPFTFRQFVYLAGGAAAAFIIYTILPFFIAILLIVPTIGFSLALTFYKINGKPFIFIVEAAFKYFFSSKLYIWKKVSSIVSAKDTEKPEESQDLSFVPRLSDSKLKDLSWSLDVLENTKDKN